jgi:hypothetical protein
MVCKFYSSANFFEISEHAIHHSEGQGYYPCRGVLQKLLVARLVRESSALFGTRNLIMKLTSPLQLSLK